VSHEAPIIRVLAFLCSALVVVMIRLRIDRGVQTDEKFEGIVWYENGIPVGRVIIEQEVVCCEKDHPGYGTIRSYRWVPVEVVE